MILYAAQIISYLHSDLHPYSPFFPPPHSFFPPILQALLISPLSPTHSPSSFISFFLLPPTSSCCCSPLDYALLCTALLCTALHRTVCSEDVMTMLLFVAKTEPSCLSVRSLSSGEMRAVAVARHTHIYIYTHIQTYTYIHAHTRTYIYTH